MKFNVLGPTLLHHYTKTQHFGDRSSLTRVHLIDRQRCVIPTHSTLYKSSNVLKRLIKYI